MKLKLDENLPVELAELLSPAHDIHTVPAEHLTGRDDTTIFQAAITEGRVLMTQDLDFSDVRQFRPGSHSGIILLRLHDCSRRRLIERVRQVFEMEHVDEWAGCFVVIGETRLRIRRP